MPAVRPQRQERSRRALQRAVSVPKNKGEVSTSRPGCTLRHRGERGHDPLEGSSQSSAHRPVSSALSGGSAGSPPPWSQSATGAADGACADASAGNPIVQLATINLENNEPSQKRKVSLLPKLTRQPFNKHHSDFLDAPNEKRSCWWLKHID